MKENTFEQPPKKPKVLRYEKQLQIDTGEFPIILEGRDSFESEIYSETLGTYSEASAVIRNDKVSEPQDIVYDFGESGGRHISARLKLRPGENTLTVTLSNTETGQTKVVEETIKLPGRLYTSGDLEFLLQEKSQKVEDGALDAVAELVRVMNEYLESKVAQIFIKDKKYPGGSATGGQVELSRFNFLEENKSPEATTWHELSHLYYDQLRGKLEDYLQDKKWKPYGEMFNQLYERALEVSFVAKADKINKTWKDIKPNSVIALFNSELYRDEGKGDHGHPQSHAGELFAYGSEILKFYPEEFKNNVEKLETEEERELALEIAEAITSAYTKSEQ